MPIEFKNFALETKLFTQAFGNFPTDDVQFAFVEEENQLVFGNKKTRVALKTSLASDIEDRLSNEFCIDKKLEFSKLDTKDLYNAFKFTSFSCAPDFDEYPYTSIMFSIEDCKFNAQSSDKHRISIYGNQDSEQSNYWISKHQAELLIGLLNKDSEYSYCISKNKFIIKWDDNIFVTSLESNAYQSVFNSFKKFFLDSQFISSAVIDKNEMTKTIKFISGISGSHIFHIKTDGTEMTISSSSNDKGAVADKITLDDEMKSFEVSFLVSHFIKVFEILSHDNIKLSFHDYNGYIICIVQEQSFDHIMFPME
jgi:DNA polymerase III sliding clamp (beta) subunit (PCNA family)